jgi:phosphatidylglycerophosphate synthase
VPQVAERFQFTSPRALPAAGRVVKASPPPMSAVKETSATPRLRILGDCSVRLWGLSPAERLRRQLRSTGIAGGEGDTANASVILLRTDYVYDQRIINDLVAASNVVLEARNEDRTIAVAAHVAAPHAAAAERLLLGDTGAGGSLAARHVTAEALSGTYIEELLKAEAPLLLPLLAEHQQEIERRLFDGSYKGVTDVVTKYIWPTPARWATRFCANAGIRPNHVTLFALGCVVVATALFAFGGLAAGLVVAWFMTFLDTVDGKLARVTIDSSRFGHALDKGVDIIHPPFWYIAWGTGLSSTPWAMSPEYLTHVLIATVVGYISGRLAEGAFTLFLGGFSMFTWRRFDSRFRLVLARRNPSLLILTLALLVRCPDLGLLIVALWHVLSATVLIARFFQGVYVRLMTGPLTPWMQAPKRAQVGAPDLSTPTHHPRTV